MGDIEGLERLLDEARSSATLLRRQGIGEAGLDANVWVLMQRIPQTDDSWRNGLSTKRVQVRPWRNS